MTRKRPETKAGQTQILLSTFLLSQGLSRQFSTKAEYLISSSSTVCFNENVA